MSTDTQNSVLMKDDSTYFESNLLSHHSISKPEYGCRNKRKNNRFQFLSIRAFVAFAGIVLCAQMALGIYGKSVLTSIEKRFGISSSVAGFIAGSFNIGNLIFVVAVSCSYCC